MKKVVILILCLLIIGGCLYAFTKNSKTETPKESQSVESKVESKEIESEVESEKPEGYDILLSKKELTIKKGSSESFEITFTNPDETSIREYIHCDDQSDIVIVKYSDMANKKINVEVEGLKAGETKILVSDYEYPDFKEYVTVKVVE